MAKLRADTIAKTRSTACIGDGHPAPERSRPTMAKGMAKIEWASLMSTEKVAKELDAVCWSMFVISLHTICSATGP